jgi:uncharacterized membrane protein YbhN (UPF0104 family)
LRHPALNYSSFVNNKYIKFSVALLIGFVCLYYVAASFNWKQIWESLGKADLVYFFSGALATLLAFFFFRTLRWYVLLKSENLNVPFVKLYLYNSVAIGISNVTPFQSGEAVKVELLRKYGGRRLTGYTIFFLEKFLDLSTVIVMGITGVSFGFDFGIPHFYFYIFAIVFAACFAAAVGVLFLLPYERLDPVKILLREKWRRKWALLAAVFFTLCSWAVAILGWKITLISVSIEISFLQSIALVSLTMLLAIISFVPGAVGVSEISITAILTKMGVDLALAQTGAIALRGYALMLLVLALLHWIGLKLFPKNSSSEEI